MKHLLISAAFTVAALPAMAASISDAALRTGLLSTIYTFDLGNIVDGAPATLTGALGTWDSNGSNPISGPRMTVDITVNGGAAGSVDINDAFFSRTDAYTFEVGALLVDGLNNIEITKADDFTSNGLATFASVNVALTFREDDDVDAIPLPAGGVLLLTALGALALRRARG